MAVEKARDKLRASARHFADNVGTEDEYGAFHGLEKAGLAVGEALEALRLVEAAERKSAAKAPAAGGLASEAKEAAAEMRRDLDSAVDAADRWKR